jgi:small subunit ribosomal protein S1
MTDDPPKPTNDAQPDAAGAGLPTSRVARRLAEQRAASAPQQAPAAPLPADPGGKPPMDCYIPEIHEVPDEKPAKSRDQKSEQPKRLLGRDLRRAIDADIEDELAEAFAEIESKGDLAAIGPSPPSGAPEGDRPSLEPGAIISVRVVDVRGDDVFVDLGGKSEGCVPVLQFEGNPPAPGETIEVVVDRYDERNDVHVLRRPGQAQVADWGSVDRGMIVDAHVKAVNKGGLEVSVNGLRGFMPAGQVDLGRIEDLSTLVGKTLRSEVMEANAASRNLVVSRKKVMEREREEAARALRESIEVGQTHEGVVRKIMDFGAFVDIGGLDGLVHVSQISWRKVRHPSEVLREGERVKVKILSFDRDSGKLGLGLRQLHENPWVQVAARFQPGMVVPGKVVRIAEFGAFVELEPGVEGLIHISELSGRRVSRPTEVVHEGDQVDVKVLEVDPERQRIALSLKAAAQEAAAQAEAEAEDSSPTPPRPKKEFKNLKGGLGAESGPLFRMPGS